MEDLTDPRMGFVTITHVELTDDLRYARIFYSVFGDADAKRDTEEMFEENKVFIKKLAVERINMKYAMDMKFQLDPSIEESFRIDSIIKKIKSKEGEE